jgi:glycosyltransferase involved in cell wall biosynthesis
MTKPKLLWCGDIVAMTGFARVTENVLERLRDDYEVFVLGNNWWGDPTPLQKHYMMYPSSNRYQTAPFGEERIREIVEAVGPDIIFSINDMWIINEQYRRIEDLHKQGKFKFVGYAPMDSYNWTGCLADTANNWDGIVSYTEFGAHEFIRGGINKPIAVIPHGVTHGQFYPVDKKEARKKLNLPEDIFIVFNGNRNQFRKRIDITIEAFAKFAKDKPDTQLYLHMGQKDQGWDLMPVFAREMSKQGLDPNGRIILTAQTQGPPNVDVEMLNTIYNSVDVGVNTCKGEGWGLVNFEHAACRVAQVVPAHTSCREIFEGYGQLIRCEHVDVDTNYAREMPCPSADHLAEILTDLYENRNKLDATAELCYERATSEQFAWDTVASQFGGVFEDVLKEVDHSIEKVTIEMEDEPKKKKKAKKEKRLVGAVS